MKARNLANRYSLPIIDWSNVVTRLDGGIDQAPGTEGPDRHTCWLTTLNPDGSPHVTAVGALWVEETFWFETGQQTRKGRNLARDPRCAISVATDRFDIVIEGTAEIVTDAAVVTAMAERWRLGGWPAQPDESGTALTADFSAPSAGGPPWSVYRIRGRRATALQTVEPGGATTWEFDDAIS